MSEPLVLVEKDPAGYAVVTLNRPQAMNALSTQLRRELAETVDRLEADPEVRVLILTGAGRGFCGGLDLKELGGGAAETTLAYGSGKDLDPVSSLARFNGPVIGAINGAAITGGFELALACDLIVAAEDAKFGVPEVKRGLVAGAGGVIRLPRRIPYHVAMEYVLTGDMMTAADAHRFGLVNRVVPKGQALQAAIELANRITANGPLALIASKRVVVESADWSLQEMWAKQAEIINPVFTSADAREGAAAFAEKRAPVWQGK